MKKILKLMGVALIVGSFGCGGTHEITAGAPDPAKKKAEPPKKTDGTTPAPGGGNTVPIGTPQTSAVFKYVPDKPNVHIYSYIALKAINEKGEAKASIENANYRIFTPTSADVDKIPADKAGAPVAKKDIAMDATQKPQITMLLNAGSKPTQAILELDENLNVFGGKSGELDVNLNSELLLSIDKSKPLVKDDLLVDESIALPLFARLESDKEEGKAATEIVIDKTKMEVSGVKVRWSKGDLKQGDKEECDLVVYMKAQPADTKLNIYPIHQAIQHGKAEIILGAVKEAITQLLPEGEGNVGVLCTAQRTIDDKNGQFANVVVRVDHEKTKVKVVGAPKKEEPKKK